MTDLSTRERGAGSILAFDQVRCPNDPRLVELYEELNTRHFGGVLPLVPVCQGIPDDSDDRLDPDGLVSVKVYPRPDTRPKALASIFLADELFETPWGSEDDRWRKIAETLLHQMVHLAVDLDARGGAHPFEPHHGEHFTGECNRISQETGWGLVRPSAQNVYPDEDSANWPDNAITP